MKKKTFIDRFKTAIGGRLHRFVMQKFPPLECGGTARPVTYSYQLDSVEGESIVTNSISIYSKPCLTIDESGEHGHEEFNVVTLTRAEVANFLRVLEEDIENMRYHCPDSKFA